MNCNIISFDKNDRRHKTTNGYIFVNINFTNSKPGQTFRAGAVFAIIVRDPTEKQLYKTDRYGERIPIGTYKLIEPGKNSITVQCGWADINTLINKPLALIDPQILCISGKTITRNHTLSFLESGRKSKSATNIRMKTLLQSYADDNKQILYVVEYDSIHDIITIGLPGGKLELQACLPKNYSLHKEICREVSEEAYFELDDFVPNENIIYTNSKLYITYEL